MSERGEGRVREEPQRTGRLADVGRELALKDTGLFVVVGICAATSWCSAGGTPRGRTGSGGRRGRRGRWGRRRRTCRRS